MMNDNSWAIVLAGGEGERVGSLTVDPVLGTRIPKQYFSFFGGASLLETTLERARGVVASDHIVVVVLASHCHFWQPVLAALPRENVIVQHANRGTAVGVLAPLLHILGKDPESRVVLFPSDHHVNDEQVMRRAVQRALGEVMEDPARPILLGITATRPDSQYGWIVPGAPVPRSAVREVSAFVEKPDGAQAESLFQTGALWSSMMMAGDTARMIELFDAAVPELRRMLLPSMLGAGWSDEADAKRWRVLPQLDLSRDVLEPVALELGVMAVPPCGWTDLGTPERVAEARAAKHVEAIASWVR